MAPPLYKLCPIHLQCKYCDYKNSRKYRVQKHVQKAHQGQGTEDDMELLGGTAKTAEFVHNMFGL